MTAGFDPETARIDLRMLVVAVWHRMWRIILVTVGLMALTYAVLMFVPKMYESSASILVESRDSTFLRAGTDAGSNGSGGSVGDTMAIASQVELIKSRDTLLSVIDSADLRDEPELNKPSLGLVGMVTRLLGIPAKTRDITDVVLANVEDRLTVIQERDSRVISVLFRAENPILAAKVANAIANAHVSRRAGLVIADTADASKWLETEIDKMRQKVADADAKVANFRITHDLYAGSDGNSSLIDQQLSDIATQITQSRERQSTANSRASVLEALIKAGKPIDSVPAVQDSTVIQRLVEKKSELQNTKAELLARLLPNHPNVVALTAQISEINQQITIEGKRIADSLDAEANIEAGIQSSLRDELTRLKLSASDDLTNGVTLAELEREAKAQRDLLETYLVRYRDASARTDVNSALPDVRVVTAAAASQEPASPKTVLILIAVAVIVLAGQIGYVLFSELVSGRAIVDDEAFQEESAADWQADADERTDAEPVAEPDRAEAEELEAPEAEAETWFADDQQAAEEALETEPWDELEPVPSETQGQDQYDLSPADDDAVLPEDPVPAMDEAAMDEAAYAEERPELEDSEPVFVSDADAPDVTPEPVATETPAPNPAYYSRYVPPEETHAPTQHRSDALPPSLRPLVDAIAVGKERVVLVASIGDPSYAEGVAELLAAASATLGLGVATIDAASGRPSANPGLGDLLIGAASFGDVVHTDRGGHLARIPWGRQDRLDSRAPHGVTLAEALSDIYHVVIITIGQPGPDSSLSVFSGIEGYLVVASTQTISEQAFIGIEAGASVLGFRRVQVVTPDDDGVQVA